MRRAALAAAALALAAGPHPAAASSLSGAEVAELAESAHTDPGALAELERVSSIDGAPADVAVILEGARGPKLRTRLETLASLVRTPSPDGVADAATARTQAAQILANDDLRPPEPPSGEGGVALPQVPLWLGLVLALGVAAMAALVARSMGRNVIVEREAALSGEEPGGARSRNLHREADEAERRGDFAAAVRLRFQAGLGGLDAIGAIELRPTLTAAGAARESGSELVGTLARAYERIAFGGRKAAAGDAAEQRSGWRAAVDEARGR